MPLLKLVSRTFRYLVSSLTDGESARLGFTQMGLGIERRSGRYAQQWRFHYEHSKALQRPFFAVGNNLSDRLAILGAGRLSDVDLPVAAQHFKAIDLFDRDPLCLPVWRRAAVESSKHCGFHIIELSGVLTSWVADLDKAAKSASFEQLLRHIENYSTENLASAEILEAVANANYRLSLNMLSQVPIFWRDNIERILVDRFGSKEVTARTEEWLHAFVPSGASLVRAQLDLLVAGRPDRLCIISDEEFTVGGSGVVDSLLGVSLTEELSKTFVDYRLVDDKSWSWVIVPEGNRYGEQALRSKVRGVVLEAI